ncbi:MaoC family dehydratase [Jatrophihabitans sp. DSM 45814]
MNTAGPVPVRTLSKPPALGPLFAKAVLVGLSPKRVGAAPESTASHEIGPRRLTLPEQPIDQARLVAYQRICDWRVSGVLPPTYLHLLTFPLAVARMSESDFPFSLLGLVHTRNSITQFRPVHSVDLVSLEVWAQGPRQHRAGLEFDVLAEARIDGEVVWRETSSYLHRETRSDERPDRRPDQHREKAVRPDVTAVSAMPVSAQWRVPADIGRRYAAISGDRNPIHLSALTARPFGFRSAIAHGMWLKARTLAYFEGRLADHFTVEASFRSPVRLPSTVELLNLAPRGETHALGYEVEVRRPQTVRSNLTLQILPA